MSDLVLQAIELELERIGAGETAGPVDSIGVNDEQEGWASLGASEARHDFYWYGRAEEILERLQSLAPGGGPAAVREEFRAETLPAQLSTLSSQFLPPWPTRNSFPSIARCPAPACPAPPAA